MSDQLLTRRLSYQQDSFAGDDKQNIPLRANYEKRKDKKFVYCSQSDSRQQPANRKGDSGIMLSKEEQIQRLKQELREQKQKVKYLQNTIIEQQSSVLKHLEVLQSKFQEVTSQKNHLEVELRRLKSCRNNRTTESEDRNDPWKEKYEQLEAEHKKVKNIANSLIDMMQKVDGVQGGVHQAWKWTKKIVWEYEGIRKKALEWKAVYDQVTQAVTLINTPRQ